MCPSVLLVPVPLHRAVQAGGPRAGLSPPALPASPTRLLRAQAAAPKNKGRVVSSGPGIFFPTRRSQVYCEWPLFTDVPFLNGGAAVFRSRKVPREQSQAQLKDGVSRARAQGLGAGQRGQACRAWPASLNANPLLCPPLPLGWGSARLASSPAVFCSFLGLPLLPWHLSSV